jgi:hypothetical protein
MWLRGLNTILGMQCKEPRGIAPVFTYLPALHAVESQSQALTVFFHGERNPGAHSEDVGPQTRSEYSAKDKYFHPPEV